ncbi:sterol carrier protein domain-containing protein [Chloroflexus sp.]|uniref:sterol carrier protein domain-containing protein n=1 Tax=Chloroflexus sp. TaxID=1904827 RepID=UPI002625B11D|nr:sterol carrier protein domain-containing protein [uncultured Chloroflexus sp.]
MTNVTINPITSAILPRVGHVIDPELFVRQQAHPRYQPEWALLAENAAGDCGISLLTHSRWQRQQTESEVAEVVLYGSNDPELQAMLLAAAADAAIAGGMAWLRCALPLRLANRWGMVPATLWSRLEWSGGNGTLTPATTADIADLVALDRRAPAPRCVTPLRYEPDWRWLLAHRPPLVTRNRSGQVIGYVELSNQRLINGRAVDAAAARSLLAQLPPDTREIELTPDHPLAQAALEMGATLTLRRPLDDEIMPLWSVIDPLTALRAHQSTFSRRLAGSGYAGWQGSIGLRGEWGAARLEFHANAVSIDAGVSPTDIALDRLSIGGLTALLLGRRSVSDLRVTGDLRCPDHGLELLESLFPVVI